MFVIEHLEPRLYGWCLIEYGHISKILGKNKVIFTDIKGSKDRKKLKNLGKVCKESITSLNMQNICVLDPLAGKALTRQDKKTFKYFLFGGILGDYPKKRRTRKLLVNKLKKSRIKYDLRNLGKEQLSTDNAVYVAKKILSGTPLNKIKFISNPEIEIGPCLSIRLPYKYALADKKPLISKDLVKLLKKKKGF